VNIHEILKYLPHRYPFLLVDKVIDFQPEKSLTAVKNVTINEPFFSGHFPKYPIMPGVLIIEALAQAAGLLIMRSFESSISENSLYFLIGVDKARFKKIVQPGDQLQLFIELERAKQDLWKCKCTASVEGQVACTANIMTGRKVGTEDEKVTQ